MAILKLANPTNRKRTTGRFETRKELCEAVWSDWLNKRPGNSVSAIAKRYKVSAYSVNKIIEDQEGRQSTLL